MTINFLFVGARLHVCIYICTHNLYVIVMKICFVMFLIQRYKERLQTKYIKSLKPEDTSKSLVGKNWIFLKDGLDDFRDGLPPPVKGEVLIKVCYNTYIAHKYCRIRHLLMW